MKKLADITCHDITRREELLKSGTLNGIDYIEVPKDEQQKIRVYFILPAPPLLPISEVSIEGGVRIRNIRVQRLKKKSDSNGNPYLEVHVDQPGDFSIYVLAIDSVLVDVAFSRYSFSFKAGCPSNLDCYEQIICPTEPKNEPLIDYLAKDYPGFRQALLDLIPSIIPGWQERHEADLGITLVELFAYVGDQLSYYQDAVANEAFLETARQRESVRRHARLIDYRMHDGVSARAFVHLKLEPGTSGNLPAQTQFLSRIDAPLGSTMPPHGPVIPGEFKVHALDSAEIIFETMTDASLHSDLNEINIYTWENGNCCLPRGATSVDLLGDLAFDPSEDGPEGNGSKSWRLKKGDYLLLEEIKGPESGKAADADPAHRQVVRLTMVEKIRDTLMEKDITRVTWDIVDKLGFPLCVSSKLTKGTRKDEYESAVSVVRCNLVLAYHGRTIRDELHPGPQEQVHPNLRRVHRVQLKEGPLSFRIPVTKDNGSLTPEKNLFAAGPRNAEAQITRLSLVRDGTNESDGWQLVPDLLDSGPFDPDFMVETRNDGRAFIRFGDGEFGMAPADGSKIQVTYRVGMGAGGNSGEGTLVHVVNPGTVAFWPDIIAVRNPLPAWGGIEPETINQVKLLAPKTFHAEQFRSVTEDDYARATEKHPEVDKAVANFRWTGSWHTVFITIDPLGNTEVTPELEARVRSHITRYKLAGYDIEIDPPVYVPLEVEINVCAARNHFRAHVKTAVLEALSNRVFPDGQKGFFHPDNFTFGQSLYISRLYEALEQVPGVDSAEVIVFKRHAKSENLELTQGFISMGRVEIVRLDNDPSFPENGVLHLNMLGGK